MMDLNALGTKINNYTAVVGSWTREVGALYFDPVPADVEVSLIDENGNITTVSLPNRAKMMLDVGAGGTGEPASGDANNTFDVADAISAMNAVNLQTLTAAINASVMWNYVTKDSNYTAVAKDFISIDSVTNGSFDITLPANPADNDRIHFLDIKSGLGANPVNILHNGKAIMGHNELMSLSTDNVSFGLKFLNNDWRIV